MLGRGCIYPTHRQQWPQQQRTYPQSDATQESGSALLVSDTASPFSLDEGWATLLDDAWLTSSPFLAIPTWPDNYVPEITVIDSWSTKQLLREIKKYPQMFARSQENAFIHNRLYDSHLPEVIQDAFTVASSYYNRTTETGDLIFRILEAKSTNLVKQVNRQGSFEQVLATTQAMMLFQIIQLFDGDIRQRSIAEDNAKALRDLTVELQVRAAVAERENPSHTSQSWREWIFAESVRRTVIVSMLIEALYSVLKTGSCKSVRALATLSFTSGAALWNIGTDTSWFAETHSLPFGTILYGDFSRAFGDGKVQWELTDFDKLLLTPCMGEKYRDTLVIED